MTTYLQRSRNRLATLPRTPGTLICYARGAVLPFCASVGRSCGTARRR